MKNIQKALFLAVMGAGLMAPVQAEEVHMIMCGGEIREADQVVISAFEAKYSGVKVNAEASHIRFNFRGSKGVRVKSLT
jgi:multiple sugar transport system substrate-binding protein